LKIYSVHGYSSVSMKKKWKKYVTIGSVVGIVGLGIYYFQSIPRKNTRRKQRRYSSTSSPHRHREKHPHEATSEKEKIRLITEILQNQPDEHSLRYSRACLFFVRNQYKSAQRDINYLLKHCKYNCTKFASKILLHTYYLKLQVSICISATSETILDLCETILDLCEKSGNSESGIEDRVNEMVQLISRNLGLEVKTSPYKDLNVVKKLFQKGEIDRGVELLLKYLTLEHTSLSGLDDIRFQLFLQLRMSVWKHLKLEINVKRDILDKLRAGYFTKAMKPRFDFNGVELRKTKTGLGVFTTKPFKKGDLVFSELPSLFVLNKKHLDSRCFFCQNAKISSDQRAGCLPTKICDDCLEVQLPLFQNRYFIFKDFLDISYESANYEALLALKYFTSDRFRAKEKPHDLIQLHYTLPPADIPNVFQKKCRFSLLRELVEDPRKDIYLTLTFADFQELETLLRNRLENDLGTGVYRHVTFLNHSCCSANTVVKFRNDRVYLIANENIKAGVELKRTYRTNPNLRGKSTLSRQKILEKQHRFLCRCSFCENNIILETEGLAE